MIYYRDFAELTHIILAASKNHRESITFYSLRSSMAHLTIRACKQNLILAVRSQLMAELNLQAPNILVFSSRKARKLPIYTARKDMMFELLD